MVQKISMCIFEFNSFLKKCFSLGTKTTWLGLGKDIRGVSCTEVKWFEVTCCLIRQLDPSLICRPLEMHLTVNRQLAECMILVCWLTHCWHATMCQQKTVKLKCYQEQCYYNCTTVWHYYITISIKQYSYVTTTITIQICCNICNNIQLYYYNSVPMQI